jgi:hypothetical protein
MSGRRVNAGAERIAASRDRAVKASAPAIYARQLAGYRIDGATCEDAAGTKRSGIACAPR